MQVNEGLIPFRGYNSWYRIVGGGGRSAAVPLLCLHGGPGAGHDYLEPLEQLAAGGRRVVFYDQLGCGNSDVPTEDSIYSVDLYLEEIDAVRSALGLEAVHILGHSWGGMLAMEYALRQPAGLKGLVLANTGASMPQWTGEDSLLLAKLPPEVQDTLKRHEAAGTTNSLEYKAAGLEFYRRHAGRRIVPRPDCLERASRKPGDHVYQLMWGPSEWLISGTLHDWDITARLHEIHNPTLVLVGRHDHATPVLAQTLHEGIEASEMVIFENSGHLAHLEETELYLQVVEQFLQRVEG